VPQALGRVRLSRKTAEEGTVHRDHPHIKCRSAPDGVLRAYAQSPPRAVDGYDVARIYAGHLELSRLAVDRHSAIFNGKVIEQQGVWGCRAGGRKSAVVPTKSILKAANVPILAAVISSGACKVRRKDGKQHATGRCREKEGIRRKGGGGRKRNVRKGARSKDKQEVGSGARVDTKGVRGPARRKKNEVDGFRRTDVKEAGGKPRLSASSCPECGCAAAAVGR